MSGLRLKLLGGFELRPASGAPIPLSARKPALLLAYLALRQGQPQGRDKLAGLFWGDSGEAQARASLRQALADLRRRLGPHEGLIQAPEGETVALARDGLTTDVAEFERCLATGGRDALERAAALYEGDLLDGFQAPRQPLLEEWLVAERQRLRERALAAMAALLPDVVAADPPEAGVRLALRILALDPLQEVAHRALMRLHARQGRRGAALARYQMLREALARELGVAPEEETQQLYRELRDRRGTAEVAAGLAAFDADAGLAPAVGVSLPPPPERPSIAVLPFANMSRDPDQEYFSDGIADDLTTDLAGISGLFVAARQSAFALKGAALDAREAGARLGVRHILEGSVRRVGGSVRITAQLIDTATGGHLWAERYDRVLTDVFAVQDEIARSIVAALRVRLLPAEAEAIRKPPTGDMEAYHLYLRGRQLFYHRTEHAYGLARRLFARAAELDPRFARAHAGIAECDASLDLHYGAQLAVEDTLARVDAALALEPGLAAAHVVRGLVLVAQGRIEAAEREFGQAIALEPNNDNAHYCHARACFQQGRMEDAARLFRRAAELSPDDIYAPLTLVGVERGLGRAREAFLAAQLTLERAERKLEGHPEDPHAAYAVAVALAVQGDRQGAARWAKRALALGPDDHTTQYNVACVYSILGEVERALDLLERTMPGASAHRRAWMARDADFGPLRDHPRFEALLRRLGAEI